MDRSSICSSATSAFKAMGEAINPTVLSWASDVDFALVFLRNFSLNARYSSQIQEANMYHQNMYPNHCKYCRKLGPKIHRTHILVWWRKNMVWRCIQYGGAQKMWMATSTAWSINFLQSITFQTTTEGKLFSRMELNLILQPPHQSS